MLLTLYCCSYCAVVVVGVVVGVAVGVAVEVAVAVADCGPTSIECRGNGEHHPHVMEALRGDGLYCARDKGTGGECS